MFEFLTLLPRMFEFLTSFMFEFLSFPANSSHWHHGSRAGALQTPRSSHAAANVEKMPRMSKKSMIAG
jgi:hypothetical protein